jgi:hypothetical protein
MAVPAANRLAASAERRLRIIPAPKAEPRFQPG